jgi:hypothetical protein
LIDELDWVIGSGGVDRTARDVALQTADELVRIAGALRSWATSKTERVVLAG